MCLECSKAFFTNLKLNFKSYEVFQCAAIVKQLTCGVEKLIYSFATFKLFMWQQFLHLKRGKINIVVFVKLQLREKLKICTQNKADGFSHG